MRVVLELAKTGLRLLRPVGVFACMTLAVFSVSRVGLLIWKWGAWRATGQGADVFWLGLRVDLASLGLLYGLAAVCVLLWPWHGAYGRVGRALLRVWLVLAITVALWLELATVPFMQEYGLRPNRLFLEYLVHPREVMATLIKGHTLAVLLALAVISVAAAWNWRQATGLLRAMPVLPARAWPMRIGLALAVLLVSALAVRSTLGHRPLNPAMVARTTDATVNVLPLNSFYAVAHAARQLTGHQDSARLYGEMPLPEVVRELRMVAGLPDSAYFDPSLPTLSMRPASWTGRPRNVVIVLEESLGAQFIGRLGGRPLSPNFDRLSQQGWAFDRLYATGTRSVRGIEAVLTGFTPTPAQAVVKLPPGRHPFYTLAESLRRRGYDTTFYYGGESHFDNMRGFFLGNGFQRVIDQDDYTAPAFTGSWGVSDEDLFDRADAEFRRLHAQGQPFFGLVFSSSNHDPFEYPEGRIQPYEQPRQTRNNAAKYADFALGRFFDKAMAAPYWRDTVFLVVADHDSRAFGKDLVPIANFHIPGLILGDGIAPRRDGRLASQIDLAPTLLSLAGIADATPMLGQDLSDPRRLQPGRALMQYDRNLAWLEGDKGVILQPDKPALCFSYEAGADRLQTQARCADSALPRRALAHALWGTLAYEQDLYRLPDAPARPAAGAQSE